MTPRLRAVPNDSEDPRLAPVFDRFRAAGREVPELYRILGNAPAMLQAWTALAWPLRTEATTDRGLRELVIMRVAQLTEASYEWWAHEPMAREFGVSEEQLADLDRWRDSPHFGDAERAVLTVTDELTTEVEASAAAVEALMQHFGPGEVIELVLTASYYNCVSRTLRTLGLTHRDHG